MGFGVLGFGVGHKGLIGSEAWGQGVAGGWGSWDICAVLPRLETKTLKMRYYFDCCYVSLCVLGLLGLSDYSKYLSEFC